MLDSFALTSCVCAWNSYYSQADIDALRSLAADDIAQGGVLLALISTAKIPISQGLSGAVHIPSASSEKVEKYSASNKIIEGYF